MRTAGKLWTAGIIGTLLCVTTAVLPAHAETPKNDGNAVRFTVDSAADIGDADPGDGRCEIAADETAKDVIGSPTPTLPPVGKGEPTIPTIYPPITPTSPEADGRCTLRAAVEESNANPETHHVVTLPAALGVYRLTGGALHVVGHLTVTRDDSPESKRAAINAGHRSRIFVATDGASLTVDGLFLAQGAADGSSGGAVFAKEATVTINRSVIVHSHADYGGAILIGTDAHLDARYTSFESNKATWGGGIYAIGSVYLDRVSVYDNTAELGGGLYVATPDHEGFWAENTSIIDNTATDAGGGLYFRGRGFSGMVHATISANEAEHGGGIYNLRRDNAFVIAYTVLAGNVDTDAPTATDASPDCDGEMSTDHPNLLGAVSGRCWGYDVSEDIIGTVRNPIDPSLEFVRISADANAQGDGGELAYRRPAFNSPALDVVAAGRCFTNDDMIRPNSRSGVPCDLGAIER